MSRINELIASVINNVHNKIDLIANNWARRVVALLVFLLMAVIGVVGCLIELFALCMFAIFQTTIDYLVGTKDDAIAFLERYIDLW